MPSLKLKQTWKNMVFRFQHGLHLVKECRECFTNETLVNRGKKYDKTAAQVILRWLIQRKVVINCKSTHKERMVENIDFFDFSLSDEDMDEIKALDNSSSLFFDHADSEMVEWFDDMVEVRKKQQRADLEQKKW